jgi:hypothetical protein
MDQFLFGQMFSMIWVLPRKTSRLGIYSDAFSANYRGALISDREMAGWIGVSQQGKCDLRCRENRISQSEYFGARNIS